jgi:hypothetical protein
MAETVFKQDNVGLYFNDHFINYKIDAEKGEGKAIAAKYRIQLFPTYLFIDEKGAIFNKAIGYCKDTVFLQTAETARQAFTDPYSLPRLKAQYAAKKKDTTYLRLYMDKLIAAQLPAIGVLDQYLAVQTHLPAGSDALFSFLNTYRIAWRYGGRTEQLLEPFEQRLKALNDTAQLKQLRWARVKMYVNTRDYAVETKSEAILRTYIAQWQKLPVAEKAFSSRQKIWLDFYSATANWKQYQPLANKWLDSICVTLKPVAPVAGNNPYRYSQAPEDVAMRRAAALVSDHAKIYYDHFANEPDVTKKALRWVKAALAVNPYHPSALTFYANLLYVHGDTAMAITTKKKALDVLPKTSLHRDLVQSNLAHMEKGEMLEEE